MTYAVVTEKGRMVGRGAGAVSMRRKRVTFTSFKAAMRYYRRELGKKRNARIQGHGIAYV